MALTTLNKVSGVLIITQTTGYGKYYGATAIAGAKFAPTNDGLSVNLFIGDDNFQIPYGDVQVSASRATSLSNALVLLNSIIGT